MKFFFTILSAVLLTVSVFAQSPQKMSYQAVIRNSSDVLVTNTTVGMQISILQGSPTGTLVYTETQTPTSNANGLVSIEIGGGAGFSTIDWANGIYFIKTETDPTGGTNYTITGTSQLLSVPYALYAKTADSITGLLNETDPVFSVHPSSQISANQISEWDSASAWGNHALEGYLTSDKDSISDFILDADNHVISNVANPIDNKDAVNKNYVDEVNARIDTLISILSTFHTFTVQQRLNLGQTPIFIYNLGFPLDSLYGKTWAGGLIFYLNTTNGSGFVAKSSDNVIIQWYNGSNVVTNATGAALGDGPVNTTTIVNVQGAGSYAASYCDQLSFNNFDDWFLPSKSELNLLYTNLYLKGLGNFDYTYYFYWSSTEYSDTFAWLQRFDSGLQQYSSKNTTFHARAIRAY